MCKTFFIFSLAVVTICMNGFGIALSNAQWIVETERSSADETARETSDLAPYVSAVFTRDDDDRAVTASRDDFDASLPPELRKLEERSRLLARSIQAAFKDDGEQIDGLKAELSQILDQAFELRQKMSVAKAEELERRIELIKTSIANRSRNKELIIENRIAELLGKNGSLSWAGSGEQASNLNTSRFRARQMNIQNVYTDEMLTQSIMSAQQKLEDCVMQHATRRKQIGDIRDKILEMVERIKAEALKGKLAQLEKRKALYTKSSPTLASLEAEIKEFDKNKEGLEFSAWMSKLNSIGTNASNNLLSAFPNPNQVSVDQLEAELKRLRTHLSELEMEAGSLDETIAMLTQRVETYSQSLSQYRSHPLPAARYVPHVRPNGETPWQRVEEPIDGKIYRREESTGKNPIRRARDVVTETQPTTRQDRLQKIQELQAQIQKLYREIPDTGTTDAEKPENTTSSYDLEIERDLGKMNDHAPREDIRVETEVIEEHAVDKADREGGPLPPTEAE